MNNFQKLLSIERITKVSFVLIALFLSINIYAQRSYELKIQPIPLTAKTISTSFELISKNQKFGIELEGAISFNEIERRSVRRDTNGMMMGYKFDEFDRTRAGAKVQFKYYRSFQLPKTKVSFFGGQYTQFFQTTHLEESYLINPTQNAPGSDFFNDSFIGQKTIGLGLVGGIRCLYKTGFLFSFAVDPFYRVYQDELPNITYPKVNMSLNIKVGYSFGLKKSNTPESNN